MLYTFVLTCEVEGPWKCSSLKPKDEKGYSPLDSSFEECCAKWVTLVLLLPGLYWRIIMSRKQKNRYFLLASIIHRCIYISNIPLSTSAFLWRRDLTVGASVDFPAVKTCSLNTVCHLITLNPQHMFTCTTLDLNRALWKEAPSQKKSAAWPHTVLLHSSGDEELCLAVGDTLIYNPAQGHGCWG